MNVVETMNVPPINLAVLISGGGTTLQNLVEHIASGSLNAQVSLVIASRSDIAGVERAEGGAYNVCG